MNSSDIVEMLRNFVGDLNEFRDEVEKIMFRDDPPSQGLTARNQDLTIEAGKLRPLVNTILGPRSMSQSGQRYDYWSEAFGRDFDNPRKITSIDAVTRDVLVTIGHIEGQAIRAAVPDMAPPKARPMVFVSHDGDSPLRTAIEIECFRIGLHPIVVEAQPSGNESVDEKVDRFLGKSQFAIVVAGFERGSEQDGERYPRAAVIDEISRIRSKLGARFIVLLEEGLRLPATLSTGIVYEACRADSYERAILAVFKSLLENGVI